MPGITEQRATVKPLTDAELLSTLHHDHQGEFANTTIFAITKSGAVYALTPLPGPPERGGLDGRVTTFRKMDCARLDGHQHREWSAKGQYVHFDGSTLHIHSSLPKAPRFTTVGETKPEQDLESWVSTSSDVQDSWLVIDWNTYWK